MAENNSAAIKFADILDELIHPKRPKEDSDAENITVLKPKVKDGGDKSAVDASKEAKKISGLYETKFVKANAKVTDSTHLQPNSVADVVEGVSLESEESKKVFQAMRVGLKEAQIALFAAVGGDLKSSAQIQELRGYTNDHLSNIVRTQQQRDQWKIAASIRKDLSDSGLTEKEIRKKIMAATVESRKNAAVNPAPFMLREVEYALDCGEEVAAEKVIGMLKEVRGEIVEEIRRPLPKKPGQKKTKISFNAWTLGDAEEVQDIAEHFAANCGVEGLEGVVEKVFSENNDSDKKLAQFVAQKCTGKSK
ncbi:MAG: hypothetical protein GY804_08310 [Alphaproteobacteria bacterium]|nr:hypothetical protein [Alphaproteobacteria bacterium]